VTVLQEDADFLAHYGKKGMKWGQRKVKTPDNSVRLAVKERRRLLETGVVTKQEIRRGNLRFGRNLILGMLAGGLAGVKLGSITTN
jgi:hypothetical protein